MSKQTYCDFNSRLFKEFVSNKKKIKPQLSDDWEILNRSLNTLDGIGLRSEKLNQEVYDISIRRFITLLNEFEIETRGGKLIGDFIIGADRSLYTGEIYAEWKSKFDERTETVFAKKDLIIGNRYKTVCGQTFIYLGMYYRKSVRESDISYNSCINWNFKNMTKCSKHHYVQWDNYNSVEEIGSNRKVVAMVDKNVMTKEECVQKMIKLHYSSIVSIISENKISDTISFERVELEKAGIKKLTELKKYGEYNVYFFKFKHKEGVYMWDTEKNYSLEYSERGYGRYNFTPRRYTFNLNNKNGITNSVPANRQFKEVKIVDNELISTGNVVTAQELQNVELREIECIYVIKG